MSKKSKEKNEKKNSGFKIPEDAKKLAKLNPKKFKKDSKDYYDTKKELKKAYYAQIMDYLPVSIQLLVRYGHVPEVKELKDSIYEKITDEDFVKYLTKEIKDDYEFDNMELLPNIIYDIVKEAARQTELEKTANPDQKEEYDVSDLVELSQLILKKKIKKMVKAGIDKDVAFDVLSTIPTPNILKKSQYFHIRALFTVLYEHAKTMDINFEEIIKILFKDDDSYIEHIITFALLERKEKISNFNDSQKKLFNDITEYIFKTLEDMKRDRIYKILKSYCEARSRDEKQNRDTNRRYYISSLPENDYPKILKVVEKICEDNDSLKKYF